MLRVGFEPTVPVFERAKTIYGLDCLATLIGIWVRGLQNCINYININNTSIVQYTTDQIIRKSKFDFQ
jgi:hypothetical protein